MDPDLTEHWDNIVYRTALRLPALPIPNSARGITAMYDVSDDWIPLYDKTSLKGWYSLRGTSGNQFKNAPVVGKILTKIVSECENGHDHDHDPIQLDLARTGQTLNLGQFSRLRDNSHTSGTVLG
eukprot:TRINITY_DN1386_c0_g1_i1.p1 TRINITY_DN1386_c0_g1~~TRINITY_DN1386_c0_g1_i1.p1  ORF type:complete len:125 (-),score=24.69 TRINITY_DN1386_c0_g1_i1:320-694(-)